MTPSTPSQPARGQFTMKVEVREGPTSGPGMLPVHSTLRRKILAAFIFTAQNGAQNGLPGDVQEARYSIVAPSGKELASGAFTPTPSRVEAGGSLTDERSISYTPNPGDEAGRLTATAQVKDTAGNTSTVTAETTIPAPPGCEETSTELCLHGYLKVSVLIGGGLDNPMANGRHAQTNSDMVIFDVGSDSVWVEIRNLCGTQKVFDVVAQSQASAAFTIVIENTVTLQMWIIQKPAGGGTFTQSGGIPCS